MAADVETVIPRVWEDALRYAVKRNKGQLKVSSIKNHVAQSPMNTDQVRALLSCMVRDGYLAQPRKHGQVYIWEVTDKGREAVQ